MLFIRERGSYGGRSGWAKFGAQRLGYINGFWAGQNRNAIQFLFEGIEQTGNSHHIAFCPHLYANVQRGIGLMQLARQWQNEVAYRVWFALDTLHLQY